MTVRRPHWWAGSILTVVRGAYGVALLAAPAAVARAYTGRDPRPVDVLLARILGVRQLVQVLGSSGPADRAVFQVGAEVDVAHASSTLGAAALYRPLRRAALIETVVAGSFAAAGVIAMRDRRPAPDQATGALGSLCRLRDALAIRVARVIVPRACRQR